VQKLIKVDSGIYLLELYISPSVKLSSTRFPRELFADGYYYYAGSAQKKLKSRIERHLKKNKKVHWHIDHLTTGTGAISRLWIFENASKDLECELVQFLQKNLKFEIPINNFGNGDCTNKCPSHLLYSEKRIDQSQLFSLYHSIVCLIPSSKEIF